MRPSRFALYWKPYLPVLAISIAFESIIDLDQISFLSSFDDAREGVDSGLF